LLGPDGAGKSAVITGIGSGRSAGFVGSETFHLRPTLLRNGRDARANCDPHGQRARGTLVSVCKLAYLLAVNWLGYLVAVRPQRARGKLVLFDRYFPDCLIDPQRYRLPPSCVPMAELVAKLLPEPDLYVVLDAPASILQLRKHEVTLAETERQRTGYLMQMARLPNGVVVDAERPLIDVVEDVLSRIIDLHLTRVRERYEVG